MNGRRDDAWLFVVAGIFALFLVLAAGGLLSALLAGHGLPTHHAAGAITSFEHVSDPSLAWKVPVGPAWLYWSITAVVLGVAAVVTIVAARYLGADARTKSDDPTRVAGLADRHEVLRSAGAKHLLARGLVLRPSMQKPKANDLGLFLGRSRNVECFASVEDSMVILGPPRSGKGYNLVIPFILDAPGAVVTTSTRPDNLAVTMKARMKRGPVGVFDPQGLAKGVAGGLRWSPIRGCEHPETAMQRAGTLCAGAAGHVTDGNFWQQQTEVVVRCLLQAAAVDGRGVTDLYRWSLSPDEAKEAVEILRASLLATPLWARALGGVVGLEPRQRASIWSVVSSVFSPFASPQVIEQLTPALGAEFHPEQFLKENGTLYLLGTSSGALATANIVSALIEDVVETARQLASRLPGARLDPSVALILDEAANYPLPSLGSLMSEGGGTGITTVAVLQSLAQARDRWGHEQAQAIWDSATSKIILGGSSNANDLRDLAQLIGEREIPEVSTTRQAGGGRNVTESTRQRTILDPSDIRLIKIGHGLLMLRAARPIMLTLRPWTQRADADELRRQRVLVEESLRNGAGCSPFAVLSDVNAESPSRDVVRRALDARLKSTPSEDAKSDPPLHWPTITPLVAEREWPELRRWVDELRERYPGVDSYVVPACWYEHESLVVALQALKDHERVAYATTSPASAGTDWHRAFRDLAALLRQFTADLRCGHGPEYNDLATFDDFMVEDSARRRRRAATVALGRPETFTG